MNYSLAQIPLFEELKTSRSILLAGAGGGFDIFSGLPVYYSLKKAGKKVVLANLSFTLLHKTTSEKVFPSCYKIRIGDNDRSGTNYFPERFLQAWFGRQGESVELYGLEKTGVNPLRKAYQYLVRKYNIDTIILVDGGTDSLMFGDEDGLGTPQEDICSMAAVYRSGVKKQYLLNLGFGVDHFHGVSHYRFLENVAQIAKDGGYLGLFQLTREMEEATNYIDAVHYVNEKMIGRESIVSNSIVSALEGKYGNHHRTSRTNGSELWINPLMTIYWCFHLRQVVRKIKYYPMIKDVNTVSEFNGQLAKYRRKLKSLRHKKQLPI